MRLAVRESKIDPPNRHWRFGHYLAGPAFRRPHLDHLATSPRVGHRGERRDYAFALGVDRSHAVDADRPAVRFVDIDPAVLVEQVGHRRDSRTLSPVESGAAVLLIGPAVTAVLGHQPERIVRVRIDAVLIMKRVVNQRHRSPNCRNTPFEEITSPQLGAEVAERCAELGLPCIVVLAVRVLYSEPAVGVCSRTVRDRPYVLVERHHIEGFQSAI